MDSTPQSGARSVHKAVGTFCIPRGQRIEPNSAMPRSNMTTGSAEGRQARNKTREKSQSKLVVAEEDDTSTVDGDNSTEYTDETDETDETETETDSVVTSSTQTDDDDDEDDDDEDDEDEDDEDDDDEEEDDDDDDDDDQSAEEDEDDENDESDASSTHTTTTERKVLDEPGLSSAAIRKTQKMERVQDPSEPLDLETAKAIIASTPHSDFLPPSVGAESMIEPKMIIQNPFSEERASNADVDKVTKQTEALRIPPAKLPLGAARQIAANEKAEKMNDSEYDLILARMVAQNRKLNQDPRAMRPSALGIGKLRQSFERLQQRNQPRSETEADGVGAGSKEFGVGNVLKEDDASDGVDQESDTVEKIDWEFWGGLINDYNTILATSPIELSKAIYSGIPSALRGMMWQLLSSSKDEDLEAQYAKYLSLPCPQERDIRRDLNRTFPTQDYFKDAKGVGQEQLYNVVKAYSLFDPECGYCQGMQFVVGPLLLNMPDEEAFSTLVRLMQNYDLRGHFIPNMPSLQLRLYQFDRLLEETQPVLHLHFTRRGIKSSMYASQWFMTRT